MLSFGIAIEFNEINLFVDEFMLNFCLSFDCIFTNDNMSLFDEILSFKTTWYVPTGYLNLGLTNSSWTNSSIVTS